MSGLLLTFKLTAVSLFRMEEFGKWDAANLVEYVSGPKFPDRVRVVVRTPAVKGFRNVPISLREIVGLCDLTDQFQRTGSISSAVMVRRSMLVNRST
jgi:hypothetical protein